MRHLCICGKDFGSMAARESHFRGKARHGDLGHFVPPMRGQIPVHPQPGFFETIEVVVGGERVGASRIEEILAQPKWSVEPMKEAVDMRLIEKGWVTVTDWGRDFVALVPPPVAKRLEADPMKPEGLTVVW